MKINQWTLGLAAVGLVSLPSIIQAEEQSSAIMTALSSTMISGYVNTSAHWDWGTGNANPPAFAFHRGKQDGFNLDVAKLSIEKPLDESQWSAGYKADLLFGPDADVPAGLGTQSIDPGGSDFGIKQAYVAFRAPVGNGLDIKLGVYDTIIGYESFDAGSNPNYTRSYGYTIEPTTHTGLLASYQIADWIGVAFGIANTFGPRINAKAHPVSGGAIGGPKAESYKTYMGSVALTAPENFGWAKGATLYSGFINGFNAGSPSVTGLAANQSSFYVGATVPTPMTNLKLGASYDYAGVSANTGAPSGYANAAALYLSFQATEKLSLHARGEYFSQSRSRTDAGVVLTPGLPRKVLAYTGTVQYDLWKNVLSRLEIRWDSSASGEEAFGGDTIGAPTKKNHVMVAANVIYKF